MGRVIRDAHTNQEAARTDTEAALLSEQARLDRAGRPGARAIGTRDPRELMAGDPASPSGTSVSFDELDESLQQRINTAGDSYGTPVQTLDDLRDVPPAAREDKQLRLVEDAESIYRFDTADTTTPDDGNLVIVPNDPGDPNGRWFKTLISPAEFEAHVADPSAHHTRYADAEAVSAMGVKGNTNPLHHDRYTDAEADARAGAAVSTHAAIVDAHHTRYLDSEAVSAMGVKDDANPLHHDRYTDAEADARAAAAVATHEAAANPHPQYTAAVETHIATFGSNQPYMSTNNTSYVSVAQFIFSGTGVGITPTVARVIGSASSNGSTASFRLFDITNALTIAEVIGAAVNVAEALISLGVLSNLPAGLAIFEVQYRRDTGGQARIASFEMGA